MGGEFNLSDSEFRNRSETGLDNHGMATYGRPTLDLSYARIGSNLRFNSVQVDGFTNLAFAQVGGVLLMDGTQFRCRQFEGFNPVSLCGLGAGGLKVSNTLTWTNVQRPEPFFINLSEASIGTIKADITSWPSQGHVLLEGIRFNAVDGDLVDFRQGIVWLTSAMPIDTHEQSASYGFNVGLDRPSYDQLAKTYEAGGRPLDAARVKIEKYSEIRRDAQFPWFVLGWLFWITIGYGYAPFLALVYLILFLLAGYLLFRRADTKGLVLPTEQKAFDHAISHNYRPPSYYRSFNALLYSLEALVPFLTFHQYDTWYPSGPWRRRYLWVHMIFGWILVTLFVLCFASDGPARINALWS
jgi:hypothetical protein